jgi:two-component system response regulator MprA
MTHILVVDNDPAVRRMITDILEDASYHVEAAENGLSALAAMNRQRPDLIVLDLLMPVMNGREFVRHLNATGSRPPVLIVSGFDAEQGRRELRAEASLEKPFDLDQLLDKVRSVLDQLDPAV